MKIFRLRRILWLVAVGVVSSVSIVQLAFIIDHVTHDPDLDPVAVQSSSLMRRLYLTGPTQSEGSLLTLFTTASDSPTTLKLHSVILNNWANLISLGVQPVLFSTFTNASLLKEAQTLAWDILPLNRTNKFGLPYFGDLYNAAYHLYKSEFYCFANADVIFDDSLVTTLKFLTKHINKERMLVVGKRTDIPVDVANPPPFHDLKFVRMLHKQENSKLKAKAHNIDFVITARHGFQWDRLKGGVVGRIGYTDHLMAEAKMSQMVIVDASETIRAVHLHGVSEQPVARTLKNNLFNHFILGGWDRERGRIDRARFYTQVLWSKKVKIKSAKEKQIELVPREIPK
ncbi:hypothetical protein CAPTEDRAFT_213787 [Capitella teleta]|uniref:Glycosyltransferase 2-like domain-containing protein n=1 Tax=Capitella teleta TaxID=283909 RepID=R7U8D8_CAPTE|nr:hypothetical protein CAPTEDRAFT_213787 [Capitella teleta]|eukprot:ELU02249.1 hypothetical protein CAPTEDRAFT_213787 [Capitella teleta]